MMGIIAAASNYTTLNYVRKVVFICAIEDVSNSVFSNITDFVSGTTPGWDIDDNKGGLINTNLIIDQSGHTTSAALLCKNYTKVVNGVTYNDWMLGSNTEVRWMLNEHTIIDSVSQSNNGAALQSSERYWSSLQSNPTSSTANPTEANVEHFNYSTTLDKTTSLSVRPQKTIIISPTNEYNVGDYLLGGVVFKVFELNY